MLVVGGLTESRMFKKFISALKNDLKSFFRPQPILGTIIKPHCIESKNLKNTLNGVFKSTLFFAVIKKCVD